jgi:hypothetical protein
MRTIRLVIFGVSALCVMAVFLTANNMAFRAISSAGQTPGGMEIAVMPDQQQYTAPSIPVVAVRAVSGLSESEPNKKQDYLMKEVILENRSTKDVSEITIRWVIVPFYSRTTHLARGEFKTYVLQSLHKTLRAGQRQTLKLTYHPRLFDLVQKVPNIERMGNKFVFLVGVSNVMFADGSSWEEELADAASKSALTN